MNDYDSINSVFNLNGIMQGIDEDFADKLNYFIENDYSLESRYDYFSCGYANNILQACGLKPDIEIVITQSGMKKILGQKAGKKDNAHDLTPIEVLRLPQLIQKPILVITGNTADTRLVFVEIPRRGRKMFAVIDLSIDLFLGKQKAYNLIASVYSQENYKVVEKIISANATNNVWYYDSTKIKSWLSEAGQLQLLPTITTNSMFSEKDFSDTANVENSFENTKQNLQGTETLGSIRTEAAPHKTITAYKLMRLVDGKLYPLYIDRSEPVELGVWYNADSVSKKTLESLKFGYHLIDLKTEEIIDSRLCKPTIGDVKFAAANGQRWFYIVQQKTKIGYKNVGIAESKGKETVKNDFALRPGWHCGSLPVMNQIGKGTNRNLRDDNFVWTEISISANIDYNAEAQANGGELYYIPRDGYYTMCTNANKKKAQADKMNWYIAGAIRINRIISDSEARQIIDRYNRLHRTNIKYDYPRESGKMFNADTMSLEGLDGANDFYALFSTDNDLLVDFGRGLNLRDVKKKATAYMQEHNIQSAFIEITDFDGDIKDTIDIDLGLQGTKKADSKADDFFMEIKISKNSLPNSSELQAATGSLRGFLRAARAFPHISGTATTPRVLTANLNKKIEPIKVFEEKIRNWDNEPITDSAFFVLYVLSKLPPKEISRFGSYYVVDEIGGYYRVRFSLTHNAKAPNFLTKPEPYKFGITFVSKNKGNSFVAHPDVFYKEHVYYTESVTSDILRNILQGIVNVLKGGYYTVSCNKELYSPTKEKYIEHFGENYEKVASNATDQSAPLSGTKIAYDYERESGKMFNADTMSLEGIFHYDGLKTPNEIYEALSEHTQWSNGAYNLISALESYYGGELIATSQGAKHAIETGLVPIPATAGRGVEYHHLAFQNSNGEYWVESVPFEDAANLENMGILFGLQGTKKADMKSANLRLHNAEPSVEALFGRKSSLLGSSNNTFSQIDIDEAKLEKNTQSAKNNLKKYQNGDYKPFDIPLKKLKLESLGRVLLWLRRLFKMIYHGQSSYNYYITPKGLLNFRISNHNANPKNFKANNADFNISVYVALFEHKCPDADVEYTEYRYSKEDYEAYAEKIIDAIINGFGHALETGEFVDCSGYAKVIEHKKAVQPTDQSAPLSGTKIAYDYSRESGKMFNADTMSLEGCGELSIVEKANLIKFLPPISLNEEEHITQKEAEAIIENLAVGTNKYDGIKVLWVKNTIGKILRHKGFDTSLLIPKLKVVFDNSVPMLSELELLKDGHKTHPNFKGYHHYVGKIEFESREYYVRFTLQEINTRRKDIIPNQFHSTYISDIKITNACVNTGTTPATANIGDNYVDTKLVDFFKRAKEIEEKNTPDQSTPLSGSDTPLNERREAAKVLEYILKQCFGEYYLQQHPNKAMVIGDYIHINSWIKGTMHDVFENYFNQHGIRDAIELQYEYIDEYNYSIKDGCFDKVKQAVGYREPTPDNRLKLLKIKAKAVKAKLELMKIEN